MMEWFGVAVCVFKLGKNLAKPVIKIKRAYNLMAVNP